MTSELETINSLINGYTTAKDASEAFTFIEFIKEFGFDNNEYSFLTLYKEYLSLYAEAAKDAITSTKDEYVLEQMVELLKSITLTYSSYEEQRFIEGVDWTDVTQVKNLIPFYANKIHEICQFYRRKRNETALVVSKNALRGSKKSVEQIIYDKVFDFMFNNKNLTPQISDLQRDLTISIENYVDVYSEYFDIPRDTELQDIETRGDKITANMNDVDYKTYLEISTVVSEILYSGTVNLLEIPLIADLALDLSGDCVGDLLTLKESLVATATINRISLTEQVALKRRLYEKYIGCDLYYVYKDGDSVINDILCTAKNPSGNLLNTCSADTATTPTEELELLSHIGLFFKPNKLSFLKINAKKYTWEIDESGLVDKTMYIFPDPSKYGDIGNNKTSDYPIAMYFDMDYDIKGLSSGESRNDPLILLEEAGWHSYYSKQQDDFKIKDNTNYQYAFSSLANRGLLQDYQTDNYGNEFGIFKGYKKETIFTYDSKGNVIDTKYEITISSSAVDQVSYVNVISDSTNAILLNGGYFHDPYNLGFRFDYDKILNISDYYRWTGLSTGLASFIEPASTISLNFGSFYTGLGYEFTDNYGIVKLNSSMSSEEIDIYDVLDSNFITSTISDTESEDTTINYVSYTSEEIDAQSGVLYIKDTSSYSSTPQNIWDVFDWLESNNYEEVIHYAIAGSFLAIETSTRFIFTKYVFDGISFTKNNGLQTTISIDKKANAFYSQALYVEPDDLFYICELEQYKITEEMSLLPNIYKIYIDDYVKEDIFLSDNHKNESNMENFNLIYSEEFNILDIMFSYNSNIQTFLIAYLYKNGLNVPYLYEHKFKLVSEDDLLSSIDSTVYSPNSMIIVYNEYPAGGTIYSSNSNSGYASINFFDEI